MNDGKYTVFHDSELAEPITVEMENPESIWHTKPVELGWKTMAICSAVSIVSGICILHMYWK